MSCFIWSSSLDRPYVPLLYLIISLASHITIILILLSQTYVFILVQQPGEQARCCDREGDRRWQLYNHLREKGFYSEALEHLKVHAMLSLDFGLFVHCTRLNTALATKFRKTVAYVGMCHHMLSTRDGASIDVSVFRHTLMRHVGLGIRLAILSPQNVHLRGGGIVILQRLLELESLLHLSSLPVKIAKPNVPSTETYEASDPTTVSAKPVQAGEGSTNVASTNTSTDQEKDKEKDKRDAAYAETELRKALGQPATVVLCVGLLRDLFGMCRVLLEAMGKDVDMNIQQYVHVHGHGLYAGKQRHLEFVPTHATKTRIRTGGEQSSLDSKIFPSTTAVEKAKAEKAGAIEVKGEPEAVRTLSFVLPSHSHRSDKTQSELLLEELYPPLTSASTDANTAGYDHSATMPMPRPPVSVRQLDSVPEGNNNPNSNTNTNTNTSPNRLLQIFRSGQAVEVEKERVRKDHEMREHAQKERELVAISIAMGHTENSDSRKEWLERERDYYSLVKKEEEEEESRLYQSQSNTGSSKRGAGGAAGRLSKLKNAAAAVTAFSKVKKPFDPSILIRNNNSNNNEDMSSENNDSTVNTQISSRISSKISAKISAKMLSNNK